MIWESWKKGFDAWENATAKYMEHVMKSPLVLGPTGTMLGGAMKAKAAYDKAAVAVGRLSRHADQARSGAHAPRAQSTGEPPPRSRGAPRRSFYEQEGPRRRIAPRRRSPAGESQGDTLMDITPFLDLRIAPRAVFDALAERQTRVRFMVPDTAKGPATGAP